MAVEGVEGTGAERIDALRAAAGTGNAAGQLELGNRLHFGDGVGRDEAEAYSWMRRAAEAGLAEAQSKLGCFLTMGWGVAADPRGAIDRGAALSDFLSKVALAGGALVVTQDTRGKPSMFWRASDSAARLKSSASHVVEDVSKDARKRGKRAQKKLDRAAHTAQKRAQAAVKDVKGVLA